MKLRNVDYSSLPTSGVAAFGHYTAYDLHPRVVPNCMVHAADIESYSIRLASKAFPFDLLRATVVSNLSKPILIHLRRTVCPFSHRFPPVDSVVNVREHLFVTTMHSCQHFFG